MTANIEASATAILQAQRAVLMMEARSAKTGDLVHESHPAGRAG
ncbi:hypothetical protein ACVBEG_16980 [Pseudomonas sp. GG8]